MEKKKAEKRKDVFENVEYVQIKKNRKQLLLLEDNEINGKSRTQLAKQIGEKLGEGTYFYTVKYFGNPKITVGKIASIISKGSESKQPHPDMDIFYEKMKNLDDKIERQASGNVNIQAIMEMKDAAYKIQIEFWKSQCDMLHSENDKLKKQAETDGGGSNSLVEALTPLIIQMLTKQPG